MASSGTITLRTQSVDYPCCPYGRGHWELTNVIAWSVNDSGYISFDLVSSSTDVPGGTWFICWGSAPYYVHLVAQVSYNGGDSWVTLDDITRYINEQCGYGEADTVAMSESLIGQLGSYYLSGNCTLRFLYYMDTNPMPDAQYPNAFPNESYSESSQVPVVVDVTWTATLKYDANGGSGAPSNQTRSGISAGTSSTSFTVSSTIPTKANHRFDGWIYGGTVYHGGDTFTVYKSTPTVTLKAVWTEYYRPGATLYSADEYSVTTPVWYSNHKTNGACHIRTSNNTWQEMRTIDGSVNGQGDPPLIYRSDSLYNQKKLGKT